MAVFRASGDARQLDRPDLHLQQYRLIEPVVTASPTYLVHVSGGGVAIPTTGTVTIKDNVSWSILDAASPNHASSRSIAAQATVVC